MCAQNKMHTSHTHTRTRQNTGTRLLARTVTSANIAASNTDIRSRTNTHTHIHTSKSACAPVLWHTKATPFKAKFIHSSDKVSGHACEHKLCEHFVNVTRSRASTVSQPHSHTHTNFGAAAKILHNTGALTPRSLTHAPHAPN